MVSRRSLAAPVAGACATPTSASRASAPCWRAAVGSRSRATRRHPGGRRFRLLPATPGFACRASSRLPRSSIRKPLRSTDEIRHGTPTARPTSACSAATSSATPPTRGCWCPCSRRWSTSAARAALTLVRMVGEERGPPARPRPRALPAGGGPARRGPARAQGRDAPPGLLRGLATRASARPARDARRPGATLDRRRAREAALSRSAFFDRFARAVGVAPMEYLLAWRMAVAKDLLRRENLALSEVAERVGYSSASRSSAPPSAATSASRPAATRGSAGVVRRRG